MKLRNKIPLDHDIGGAELPQAAPFSLNDEPVPSPRVFLLDDDPVFCRLMAQLAARRGVPLSTCSKLAELGNEPGHRYFDVAVVDFHLEEDFKGTEFVGLWEDRPVVLVSRSEGSELPLKNWPESVRAFVPKRLGPEAVLKAAIQWGLEAIGHSGPDAKERQAKQL